MRVRSVLCYLVPPVFACPNHAHFVPVDGATTCRLAPSVPPGLWRPSTHGAPTGRTIKQTHDPNRRGSECSGRQRRPKLSEGAPTLPSAASRPATGSCLGRAAVREQLLQVNPARLVVLPRPVRHRPQPWTRSRVDVWQRDGRRPVVAVWTAYQLAQFLAFIRADWLFALWWLTALRGLRRGELCALRWTDLDLDTGTITISRQGRPRQRPDVCGAAEDPPGNAPSPSMPPPWPYCANTTVANVYFAATPAPPGKTPGSCSPGPTLNRSQPVLPMMPGMPERRTYDYARHGITSLVAAFNVADGSMISELHRQHRAAEFKKVPGHHRQDRARRPGHPPDLRQLRHPRDPRDQSVAGPTPPLPHARHADWIQLDQPGRTLVRVPHRAEDPPRRSQVRPGPRSRLLGKAARAGEPAAVRLVRPSGSVTATGRPDGAGIPRATPCGHTRRPGTATPWCRFGTPGRCPANCGEWPGCPRPVRESSRGPPGVACRGW